VKGEAPILESDPIAVGEEKAPEIEPVNVNFEGFSITEGECGPSENMEQANMFERRSVAYGTSIGGAELYSKGTFCEYNDYRQDFGAGNLE